MDDQLKDVEYYNKEIIKIKQRNNKVTTKTEFVATPGSFGLVTQGVTTGHDAVDLAQGQEEAKPDFSHGKIQAPTSPPNYITDQHVKRAVIQYYQNQGANLLQKHKLKIRLNCDFGDGEESVEFIAALTQDLGNFKKYHPEESRVFIQDWVDDLRQGVRLQFEVKPWMGKFHSNPGWNHRGAQFNQIEPWTACVVWYDKRARVYRCALQLYQWQGLFELNSDTVTDRQIKANVRAQKLWHNPQHTRIQRPQTWAEKRGLK